MGSPSTPCDRLYGLGVGPGDPELLTLKALRLLRDSAVLLLPAREAAHCRAYQIVLAAEPALAEKPIRCLDLPMTRDPTLLAAAVSDAASASAALLRQGLDLCFLTLGDPCVYSTFSDLAESLRAQGFPVETVSGVSVVSACAASLGLPLVSREEELHLIPGDGDLDRALALPGTKVFLKLGRRLPRLKEVLRPLEAAGAVRVWAVQDCGPGERCWAGTEQIPDDAPYMTTVLVKDAAP